MSMDLQKIYNRINKTIQANFPNSIEILAIVNYVDLINNYFTISLNDNTKTLKCRTILDFSQLKKDDNINLKASLKVDSINMGKLYLNVEYFFILSEKEIFSESIDLYGKLLMTLQGDKCTSIINKIKLMSPPQYIKNIALLVFPNDEENIINFKISFQEKCGGKLIIFRLDYQNDDILRYAFEYFKKYHDIDLICLLTNRMKLIDVCTLSSKNNIRYLLNRKNTPYLISITNNLLCNNDEISMEPLSVMLSNEKIVGINNFTDYIHNNQTNFKKKISDAVNLGKKLCEIKLQYYKNEFFKLQLLTTELYDSKYFENINKLTKLKNMILNKLLNEKISLMNKFIIIMKNIIDDVSLKKLHEYPSISNNMKQENINIQSQDLNENDLNNH